MHCLYCNAENPDTAVLCLSCGHALPAAKAHKTAPATPPNYAFPFQARPENARIVGKREFRVKAGVPPPLPAHPSGSGARGLSAAAGTRPLVPDTAEVLAAPAAEPAPAVATAPQNPPEPGPAMRPKLEPELRPASASRLDSGPEPLHPAHGISPNHANAGFGPGRQTPYFDEAAFGAGDAGDPGDASKYIAPSVPPPPWHEYDNAAPSSGKLTRAALLLCIFALGAGSGAAALWWTANPDTLQQTLAARLAGSVAPALAPADAPDAAALGTPAGELPYDGLAASAASTPNSTPASVIAPATSAAPEAGADSAASAAALAAAPAQPQPAQESAPNPKNTVAANTASNTPPLPDSVNAADLISAAEPIAASRVTPAPPAAETPPATLPASAKTGKKRPLAQSASSAKADDGESPAGSRSARTARASSNFSSGSSADSGSSGQRSLTPLMIAQCESMSDRSERILCKQEVCNGKWGSNGCPASPHGGSGPR